MNTHRRAIEMWLLLDDCRLPRVFTIIDALLDVIEQARCAADAFNANRKAIEDAIAAARKAAKRAQH